jgi:hypothetical protein
MSPTTRTTDREISSSEVLLAWWDLDDDLLQRWDLDDDSLLISTDNRTTWTPRTPI